MNPKRRHGPRAGAKLVACCILTCLALAGCTRGQKFFTEENIELSQGISRAAPSAFDRRFIGLRFDPAHQCRGVPWMPRSTSNPLVPESAIRATSHPPRLHGSKNGVRRDALSPGDLVELSVIDGDIFSGTFVIGPDGTITVPHLPSIQAASKSPDEVEKEIENALVDGGFFHRHAARADLVLRQFGEISVSVGGSVFSPGLVSTAERSEGSRDEVFDTARGSNNWRRRMSGILRAAGGVRPDADLSRVALRRRGQTIEFDMTGIFTGAPIEDPIIVNGDYVFLPTMSCFSPALTRPSRITPPGIRIFISNPTAPIYGNNPAAIDAFSTRLPYGSRLLQALVSGNCLGGTELGNAKRYAILIGENPLSGRPEGLQINVEEVIRNPGRADLNPYLQAGDAIACYDSGLINIRDLSQIASSVLSPAGVLKSLIGF